MKKKNSKPFVSVIIPVFNAGRYLDDCIISIMNQTYQDYEIILCDDCSTDGSLSILHKYDFFPNVRVLANNINMKQAATRNRCLEESIGDFVLIQDADDVSEPNRIEKLLQAFEPQVDFVGSACYCFNSEDGQFDYIINKCEYPQPKDLLRGLPFVHASLLFRRESLVSVGGYRQSKHTRRGEDYDLIMRLYAKGYRGKNLPDLLYGYRVDRETILRRDFRARVDECCLRFEGFKLNRILLPFGWIYVLKPIVAHLYQMIRYRRFLKDTEGI